MADEGRAYHGHAVVNGVPQYFSVSALERADIRSGGCLRKWWYRYVGRKKDEVTKSKTAGLKLHAELAQYLRTGDRMLSALATRGLFMVPDPGPDLLVEQSIGGPKAPYLTADGIPLVGQIDCAHDRCTNKGGGDIGDTSDPPGTIEVIDWKWKGDGSKEEYYLQRDELVQSIQMAGYGKVMQAIYPSYVQQVRLSHGYFPATRGQPRKVTKLHVIADCNRTWEYVDTLGRTLRDVARETNADKVTANRHSCDKYGGCPNRSYCTAYQKNVEQYTMSAIFGETAAKEMTMGLMNTLPQNLQPQTQQPDVRAQLAAEETQQRAQAAQTSVGILPGFAEAWSAIERSGRGFPALGGGAAQMRAALVGQSLAPQAGLAGGGELGQIMIQDPAHIVQLGNECLAAERLKQQPVATLQLQPIQNQIAAPVHHVQHNTVPAFLPPDAPQPAPANSPLAAKPLDAVSGAASNFLQQLQPAPLQQVATYPQATQAEAPKKRGRRTKAEMEAARANTSPSTPVMQQPAAVSPSLPAQAAVTGVDDDLEVYVDCIPNCEYESIHPYIDQILAALVKKFIPEGYPQDVRCGPKDGPLAFGGWRGGVHSIVTECPPANGCYFIDTRSNEIAAEVADAMRVVCEARNARFTRGIR